MDYLRTKNFDISDISYKSIDKQFDGIISIKKWNGEDVNKFRLKDGLIKYKIKKSLGQPSNNQRISEEVCVTVITTEQEMWCQGHYQGDVLIIDECGEWEETGNVTYEDFCLWLEDEGDSNCEDPSMTLQECFCDLIGGCYEETELPVDDYLEHHAKMCGEYNWGTIGNAFYTQFKPTGFSLVNSRGAVLSVSYGTPCIQFSKSNVYTTNQANAAWNEVWNQAIERVQYDCNHGGPLGDHLLRQKMTNYMKEYLQANFPGSSFNAVGCQGSSSSIPHSDPKYCL